MKLAQVQAFGGHRVEQCQGQRDRSVQDVAHQGADALFAGKAQKQAHLLELCRYVVLNPLRAKAVPQLDSWCWSSYRATAGVAAVPEFLTVDWVLAQFGATRSPAQAHYRAFVKAGLGDHPWGRLKGRIYLGNEVFVKEHPLPAGDLAEIPRAQRQAGRPTLEEIFRNAGPDALPKAYTEHGYRMREIAEFLHVHYATISRRLRRLEQHSSTRGPVAPSVTAATQFPVSATGDMLDCKT